MHPQKTRRAADVHQQQAGYQVFAIVDVLTGMVLTPGRAISFCLLKSTNRSAKSDITEAILNPPSRLIDLDQGLRLILANPGTMSTITIYKYTYNKFEEKQSNLRKINSWKKPDSTYLRICMSFPQ